MRATDAIFVVSAGGARARRVALDAYVYTRRAWAPGGRTLVFSAWRSSALRRPRPNLVAVDVGAGRRRWLTADVGHDYDAAWSPDGASIAYTSDRGDRSGDLWVMRRDGSRQRKLAGSRGSRRRRPTGRPTGAGSC